MSRLNAMTIGMKSLHHQALASFLTLLLMTIAVGMMTFVLSVGRQLEDGALRDASGIDLVVGAKGSPLQLILSSVYHADIPTGNIPLSALAQIQANPLVKSVIPLALGDNFQGFRIVGTTPAYAQHYGAELANGAMYTQSMQAVFGAQAAKQTGAIVGAKFSGSHGLTQGGELHSHAPYVITGILKPTGTVLDRLILTPVDSVWRVHETDPDEQPATTQPRPERELTALLVQYTSPLAMVSIPRWINSQTRLQAAQPAFEAAKLFHLMSVGSDVLRTIAIGLLAVAAFSMLVALYNALEARRVDLAILRVLGASPQKLLQLLLMQGLLLSCSGAALGWILGHASVGLLGYFMVSEQSLPVSPWQINPDEAWLALIAIVVGLSASALPAYRAYKMEIATTLSR